MIRPKNTRKFYGESNLLPFLNVPKPTEIDGTRLFCRTWRKYLINTYVSIFQLQQLLTFGQSCSIYMSPHSSPGVI